VISGQTSSPTATDQQNTSTPSSTPSDEPLGDRQSPDRPADTEHGESEAIHEDPPTVPAPPPSAGVIQEAPVNSSPPPASTSAGTAMDHVDIFSTGEGNVLFGFPIDDHLPMRK
jgi:hypothetical protein